MIILTSPGIGISRRPTYHWFRTYVRVFGGCHERHARYRNRFGLAPQRPAEPSGLAWHPVCGDRYPDTVARAGGTRRSHPPGPPARWLAVPYDATSTVFCTQYAKKDWHQRLGSDVHADAIMDRTVHNTIWIETGAMNMREHTAATG